MTFFGWGKKRLEWLILVDGNRFVIYCLYSYFSINFLQIVLGSTWHLYNTETESLEEIEYTNLVAKFGDKTPKLGWHRRFTLFLIPASVGIIWYISYHLIHTLFPPINL